MKKISRILLLAAGIVLVLALMIPTNSTAMAAGGFAGGTGTLEDPWLIETPEHLASIAEAVYYDKHFKLIANIDLTAYLSEGGGGWNGGAGWAPIGTQDEPFTGNFDGGGFTISNLIINRPGTNYIGLFGSIGSGADIRNVDLEDMDVTGAGSVGGLAGYNNGGDITACSTAGEVAGLYGNIGGLVGYNSQGTIADSYATTAVTAGYQSRYTGGLVGSNSGTVSASFAAGTVTGDNESYYIGGLVGKNDTGSIIEDSYATGAVTGSHGTQYFTYYIGGLVGGNSGMVSASNATGAVTGDMQIGGLVGCNDSYISNCYATGSVSGKGGIGGLVGQNDSVISNSYAAGSVSGQASIGGLVGYSDGGTVAGSYYDSDTTGQSDTGKGQPKNTVEMKQQATFAGWDFTEQGTWRIVENNNYPVLRWQPLTPQEIEAKISIDIDCDALEIIYAEGDSADRVTRDLTLPWTGSNGTTISWSSSNVLVITDDGTVTRPDDGNKTVTMTATVSKAGGTDKMKEFQLTVEAVPIYALTIASGTGGSITTGSYAEGTVIDISAAPNSGYKFNKWTTTNGGTFGNAYSAGTTFTMPANATTITATFTYTGSGGGGGGGGGTQAPAPVHTPAVDSTGNITTVPKLDQNTGVAEVEIDSNTLATAFARAAKDSEGKKTVKIEMSTVKDTLAYEVILPASALTSPDVNKQLEIRTGIAAVTLPANMLTQETAAGAENISLTIAQADVSGLDEETRDLIGDRPVIQLGLKLDGEPYAWSNESAPVTVSIPYKPTEEELADPEHITVWYIDGTGNVVEVPSGRYDPATGTVTFSTTHFSSFAVVYAAKTFDDLESVAWAKKPIEVLASKGILKGVAEKEYAPQTNITRADFLCFLVRTLGVDARVEGNFDDLSRDAYYYKEIGTAKKLGITSGTGNNKFSPDASITRQDMMVLTENALRMLKKLEGQGTASDLDRFTDKSLIAAYAVNGVASVVKEGLIVGSGDRINPLGNTTRAEAAVFLHRIYNKY